MKTIKQIAADLGVSKQTIRDRIAKLGLQSTLQKNGNTFALNEQQEALIKKDFFQLSQSESQSDLQSESQSTLHFALRLLEKQNEQLRNELEIKNKQIDELNLRLAEAMATANNVSQSLQVAQGLHAGTIHQTLLPDNKKQESKGFLNFFKRVPR